MKTSSSRTAGKRPKFGIALPWAWNQGGKIRGHRIQTRTNTSRLRPLGGTRCINAVGVWRCIRGVGGRVGWRATQGSSSHPSGGCPRPAVILPGRSPRAVRTPPGGSSGARHGGWVLLPLPSPPATLRPRRSQRARSDRRGRSRGRPPGAPLPERGTAPSSTPRAPRWSLKGQASLLRTPSAPCDSGPCPQGAHSSGQELGGSRVTGNGCCLMERPGDPRGCSLSPGPEPPSGGVSPRPRPGPAQQRRP